jgi:hypothetical protein
MLSMSSYPAEYVSQCKARVRADVEAFAASGSPAALEEVLFRNMLLALDGAFAHRGRGIEGKDGNPLNEVRVLCSSVLLHDGVMTAETSIKLDPARSVLRIPYGERVSLDGGSFSRIAEAFFGELEARFVTD